MKKKRNKNKKTMVPLSKQGLINVRPSLAPDFVYECLMNKIIYILLYLYNRQLLPLLLAGYSLGNLKC